MPVLQVSRSASSHLRQALEQGNSSYDPSSAVTLYFASARNQVTTLSLTVPAIMALANTIITQISTNTTASYLQTNPNGIPPTTLQCPQCLTTPFSIHQTDLIPFSSPTAIGPLTTGLIFLLTFTLNIFTILRSGASSHGHIFTLRTTLLLRTFSSLAIYLFLSLNYTLGILAFSIPLTGHFASRTTSFIVLWLLNFLTMCTCGLVMEGIFTFIGMRWAPYFLNIWLIANASAGLGSFETMGAFYKFGYGMPFWAAGRGTRTVVFGTKSYLGTDFGVLAGWCVVGWVGVVLGTGWRVRVGRRRGRHEVL